MIVNRYNSVTNDDDISKKAYISTEFLNNLETLKISSKDREKISKLAKQMALALFPPTTESFKNNDIEPWPLMQSNNMMNSKIWGMFAVINMDEVIHHMRFSKIISLNTSKNLYGLIYSLFSNNIFYHTVDFTCPPVALDLYRRAAIVSSHDAKWFDEKASDKWELCVWIERLTNGKSNAVSLLHFATNWIKGGRPLSMLSYVEEAVTTMQQDFSLKNITHQQISLLRHNKEWLKNDLPELTNLVAGIPEYKEAIHYLQSLKNAFAQ